MNNLKSLILEELEDDVKKEDELIKKLEEKRSGTLFAKSTITGGAFSTAARNSCDKEISEIENQINNVKQRSAWKRKMLSKYN